MHSNNSNIRTSPIPIKPGPDFEEKEENKLIDAKKGLEKNLDLGEFIFSSLSTTSSTFSHRCTRVQQVIIGLIRNLLNQ